MTPAQAFLRDHCMSGDCPPASAWRAAVALTTAEFAADDEPDGAPARVLDVIGSDAELFPLVRALGWIAAELGAADRDRTTELLQDLGAAAAAE